MISKLDPKRCVARVWENHRDYQCSNKPKIDGYCGIHDPKRAAAKKAERVAKWDEQSRLRNIGCEIDTAREKAWNTLTAASTDAEIVAVVRAALKKIAALEASK